MWSRQSWLLFLGSIQDGDYLGRQCCSLSPVHRCQTACLKAKQYSEDLATECRKSDNMQLFQCLNLIRVRYLELMFQISVIHVVLFWNRRERIAATYRLIHNAEKHVRPFTAQRRHPLPERVSIFRTFYSRQSSKKKKKRSSFPVVMFQSNTALTKVTCFQKRKGVQKTVRHTHPPRNCLGFIIPPHAFSVLLTKGLKLKQKNNVGNEKK